MIATPSPPAQVTSTEIHSALDRILASESFRKSPSLSHLLQYLVIQAFDRHVDHIKEAVIAIEVFERRHDFDGRTDNIVRVQAHRLRKTLDNYYASDGRDQPFRFLIPKGNYLPQIVMVEMAAESTGDRVVELHPVPQVDMPASRKRDAGLLLAGVFLAGLVGGGVALWLYSGLTAARLPNQVAPAVVEIWEHIFEPGVPLKVTYTNPAFLRVGQSQLYLQYRGAASAPAGSEIVLAPSDPWADWQNVPKGQPLIYGDGWTGTGEVLAVNRLTTLGLHFGDQLSLTPSRTLAFAEMRGANVVFLGSPWGNGELARIGLDKVPIYETGTGRIIVRNNHPDEPAFFSNETDAKTRHVTARYSVFSVLPGVDPGRKIVSSAGLGTQATWAGIDFATSAEGAAQLVRTLKAANGGILPEFYQGVIRTEMIKDLPSNPTLVMTRVVSASVAAPQSAAALP